MGHIENKTTHAHTHTDTKHHSLVACNDIWKNKAAPSEIVRGAYAQTAAGAPK